MVSGALIGGHCIGCSFLASGATLNGGNQVVLDGGVAELDGGSGPGP